MLVANLSCLWNVWHNTFRMHTMVATPLGLPTHLRDLVLLLSAQLILLGMLYLPLQGPSR